MQVLILDRDYLRSVRIRQPRLDMLLPAARQQAAPLTHHREEIRGLRPLHRREMVKVRYHRVATVTREIDNFAILRAREFVRLEKSRRQVPQIVRGGMHVGHQLLDDGVWHDTEIEAKHEPGNQLLEPGVPRLWITGDEYVAWIDVGNPAQARRCEQLVHRRWIGHRRRRGAPHELLQ